MDQPLLPGGTWQDHPLPEAEPAQDFQPEDEEDPFGKDPAPEAEPAQDLQPEEEEQEEEDPQWLTWLGDWREWVQDEAMDKAMELYRVGRKVTNFHFSGPAIDEIRWVTAVLWVFALAFCILASEISECPDNDGQQAFAHYPCQVWVLFFLVMGYSAWREIDALKWVLPSLVMYCAPFQVFGQELTLNEWMVYVAGMGVVAHVDLATNGLFLAKIVTTVQCHRSEAEKINRMWRHVIKESIVWWVPGADRLDVLVLVGYCLMYLQPTFCFLYSWPWKTRQREGEGREEVSYEAESMMYGYRTPWSVIFRMNRNRFGECVLHHADVLQWLGTANRMVSLVERSLPWALARATEEIRGTRRDKWARGFNIIAREFARITHRLWLVNLIERVIMLEMQASIFAISRCLITKQNPGWPSYQRVDGQMLFSLLCSGMTLMKVVYDSVFQFCIVLRFALQRVPMEEVDDPEEFRQKRGHIWWSMLGFSVGFILLIAAFVHSITKIIMAFACPYSLWDIPGSEHAQHGKGGLDQWGCVDVGYILEVNP